MNSNQRAINKLRGRGWTAGLVQYYNHRLGQRRDLWSIVDVIAIHPKHRGTLYVQATTHDAIYRSMAKVAASEAANLIAATNRLEIWSFRDRDLIRLVWRKGWLCAHCTGLNIGQTGSITASHWDYGTYKPGTTRDAPGTQTWDKQIEHEPS